ncbi:lysylphosphatidylglycerol synthase transmembrane domain-containing protein [Dactylosporangium sp. NPDC000555]|uniref:lysylphosphatidylglycerol synthase transmembrane domain-containing protein n=1 Tax=Dactylosporangium sp. NPDC000555 TaxID=3154260 RepID=UPI00331F9DF3
MQRIHVPAPEAAPDPNAPASAVGPDAQNSLRARGGRRAGVQKPKIPWGLLRTLGGLAVLAMLLWRLGSGPFLAGLRMIDAWALVAALGVGAATIVACAWRWRLVARGLGMRLPLRTAIADCYRGVLINSILPGGVLGDVDRAVGHGREHGDVGRGIRAVVWERTAGQVVQCTLAVALLWALPSPVRPYVPRIAIALAVVGSLVALLALVAGRRGPQAWRRAVRAARADVREVLLARRIWPGVVFFSAVAVGGHLVTFLLAARTAGLTAPAAELLPLTLLALLAMGLPANVGGFGPREGVAAWAFGAAGLTAAQGVATATVYGVLVLVSSLPGVAVLLFRRRAVAS